ncbi:MobA/MobL family protein [Psychrobacter sp. AOP7-B1-24]|uniref:MobA/MobL family protein n=1 Tax=Psychrobacter sp. AOP7-B1-24 TaxID=3457645 RepID=UPI00402B3E5A
MAIYRLEKKSISRGNNHNLVAAVAYRAGAKFTDTNKLNPKATTHDYTKKTDVAHSEIILPDELAEQLNLAGINLNLEQVANLVEQGETTKRGKMKTAAKLASEYVLAGSHELSQAENIQAFQEFAKQQAEEQGVVAMVFVHDPKQGEDMSADTQAADNSKGGDLRNIHAHVVVLSRQLVLSGDQLQLGDKSNSELSDTARKKKFLEKNRDWLKGVREQWADIQNQSLERHNLAPVTHKSYRELGLEIKPGIHLGKDATALVRKNENLAAENKKLASEGRLDEMQPIKTIYRHQHNRTIDNENRTHIEQTANSGITSSQQQIERSQRWIDAISTGDAYIQRQIEQANQQERSINSRIGQGVRRRSERPNPYEQQLKTSADNRKQRATELHERTIIFDRASERADRNARYRKPRINGVIGEVDRLTMKTALLFSSRRNESSSYTDRQKDILERFANENSLVTGDFREDIRVTTTFFSDADNAQTHKHIVKLINDPETEEQNYSKTSKFEAESDLNELTRDIVGDSPKTSNAANESVSIAPRGRRRP